MLEVITELNNLAIAVVSLFGMLAMVIGYFWKLKYDREVNQKTAKNVDALTQEFIEHKNTTALDAQATRIATEQNSKDIKQHIEDCNRNNEFMRNEIKADFKTVFDKIDEMKADK